MFRIFNHGATKIASRSCFNSLQALSSCGYVTGERYAGYVTFYHPEDLFGFVVREDLPEREYHFHATDMQVANIPRVREFTQVEFSLTAGRGGNYMARDVTALNGHPIDFHHPNLRLQKHERTLRLSELGEAERHRGVVVTCHDRGGMVVPDRLNYDALSFNLEEIQSTGTTSVPRFCEVEFSVRAGRTRDLAVCITRPGGGLITTERRVLGARRRAVGNMYFNNDTAAKVPYEFSQDRRRGYIESYNPEKLFGFLVDLDTGNKVFVHIDDGHMFGKRAFRRFQAVEYYLAQDADGREKAMHVTGPNSTVLRYNSPNFYLPKDQLTEHYATDGTSRHTGVVIKTTATPRGESGNTFGIIRPDEAGFDNVLFFNNHVSALSSKMLERGDAVEFSCDKHESPSGEERTSTTNITMPGGRPIVVEGGSYGAYLRQRYDKNLAQRDLAEVPLSGQKQTGWISSWGMEFGTIEIEAPAGERYRKVTFTIDDCAIPDDVDKEKAFCRRGYPVECIVEQGNTLPDDEQGETAFTQKASNITSLNSTILETRQRFDREYQEQGAVQREDDGFAQTMEL